jgi:hypothetical protein
VDEVFPPSPLALGFVDNYKNAMLNGTYTFGDAPTDPRKIMTCYTPDQTPVLSTLAKKYAVCDQYFCSIPSQTLPNRNFVHAATSTGYVNNNPNNQCDAKTIYNQIQDAIDGGRDDLSWGIYNGTQKKDGWVPFSLTRMAMVQIQNSKFDDNFKRYCQLNDIQTALPIDGFIPLLFGHDLGARHLLPFTECPRAKLAIVNRSRQMPTQPEQIAYNAINGEKALRLAS